MNEIKRDFSAQTASDAKTTNFQNVIHRLRELSQAYTKGLETGKWQTALDEIETIYARHRPEENEFYLERDGKNNIRKIIHSFTNMRVADTNPEAALKMLKYQYDNAGTPEIITNIGRRHALNGQNTPHIPLMAAQTLEHVYHAAKADEYPGRRKVMENVEWQITKLGSRLIKGTVVKKLEEMKLKSTFTASVENGEKTDRAAAMTVPVIIQALEKMEAGAPKLQRLLKNRNEELPGLDYRTMIQEALSRIEQSKVAPALKAVIAPEQNPETVPAAPKTVPAPRETQEETNPTISVNTLALDMP